MNCTYRYGHGCSHQSIQYVRSMEYGWRASDRKLTRAEQEWLDEYRRLPGPCPAINLRCK